MSMRSVALLAALLLAAPLAEAQEHVAHGRFADVALYRPAGETKSFVLFLSGDGGWNRGVDGMARALAGEGALVAGVDVPRFLASFSGDATSCVNPDGDLDPAANLFLGREVPRGGLLGKLGFHFDRLVTMGAEELRLFVSEP